MVPVLDGTPASVDPATGTMLVSAQWWNQAPFEERLFVLLHECGHLEAQGGEFEADRWALETYAREGHSLQKAVLAMKHYMPFNTMEQYQRATALLRQALLLEKSPKG
ncbi:hypothetical protein [Spirosoma aerolatum]|uniref:hypothetical protein n=1 Tax=Spirosoma aerolatum TaxID=1211326 RepID=UPI0012D2C903|nr:hypothetical protein [Spirosoma aerolatum]